METYLRILPALICRRAVTRVVLSALPLLGASCGSLPDGERWGGRVTLTPGFERLGAAVMRAATDPHTWVPAAGALIFAVDDFDEEVSEWAAEHTPVFGSRSSASDASDSLRAGVGFAAAASLLATPSGETGGEILVNKSKGAAVEISAAVLTQAVSNRLKSATDRKRPNGEDRRSFPSAHASSAASFAALSRRNINHLDLSPGWKRGMRYGVTAAAWLTAWARVEANEHFSSDALAGLALGNFISVIVHDAFLGLDENDPMLSVSPQSGGALLQFSTRY